MFLLVGLALLIVLPSPWNLIGFVGSLVLFVFEALFWNGKVRHRRASTGSETLVGKVATVVSPCRPDGQVRLSGEIWAARCDDGADIDEEVVVSRVDGLRLVVARQT